MGGNDVILSECLNKLSTYLYDIHTLSLSRTLICCDNDLLADDTGPDWSVST